MHLGLGDPLPEISREYYERHEIRHADLYSITQGCSRREIRASLLKAVGCSSVCFWLWQRFGPLGILEEVIFEAEDYYVRMAQFPAVRVVLVGYEVLFPPALALACNRLGIVTVATQERFSNAFFPADLFAVEHYFFLGEQARSMIKRRGFSWIGKEHILGPARVKNLRKAMVQSDPGKYQAIRAKQKLVLVLDFHSEPSFNENRLVDNHWEHNQRFYRDIIRLAEHFQTAHFVIKGKNADWLELDYFSSVREEIEGIGNVSVETDLREYDPARMAAITDLCIAMYNSLGDELLAIDRPVIFYDFYGMPADFYDFEKTAACATTFGELMAATTRGLQTGRVLEPRDSERIRRKCYGYENGLPSEGSHLLDTLHSIYNGP
ncbi:MAG: hypothetical protein KDK37_19000, partial [Leptospiraceae bacterium]|nr:hypothetical protein [Leptospiraceae bacterium]